MSKNIIIQEGGIAKQMTVDKLETNLFGGGTCLWIPEDGVQLGTKSVSENGTYVASNDGYYGYSQFSVSGVGTATGRDPVTGQEKSVTVDPETGDLVETVVPSEIRVITPPTNPYGTYIDGQIITKDGMVVKAYDANGAYMQDIPIGELSIDPIVATYDPSKDMNSKGIAHGDIDITFIDSSSAHFSFYKNDGTMSYEIYDFDAGYKFLAVNGEPCIFGPGSTLTHILKDKNGEHQNRLYLQRITCDPSSLGAYYYAHSYDVAWSAQLVAQEPALSTSLSFAQIAGILKSAPIEMLPSGSPQTITVSWPRTGDSKVLTATFDILVGPRAGSGED